MILTTKSRYAIMAMIEIADNQKSGQPVSLQTISQRQEISLFYLEKIFSCLRSSGMVKSVKGSKGGYILADNYEEITIANIIRAIGEPIKMTRCTSEKKSCTRTKNAKCKTHHLWQGLEQRIYEYFDSISLRSCL